MDDKLASKFTEKIDREEDGEMASGFMQEQYYGQELQEIKINGIIYTRRATSYTLVEHDLK